MDEADRDGASPRVFLTAGHLLLCTGPSCAARGAHTLFDALWQALEHERLAYYCKGGSVRLTESGCLGACAHGPNLTVYRRDASRALEEGWYAGMDVTAALAVARAVHDRAALPVGGRYDQGGGERSRAEAPHGESEDAKRG